MAELFAIKYSFLIPLLPLCGAAIAGLFGARFLRQQSHWPIWIGVGISAILSLTLLFGMLGLAGHEGGEKPAEETGHPTLSYVQDWFTWIQAGDPKDGESPDPAVRRNYFQATAGFFFDPLTAVMLCVVTGIGFLIMVFSKGYMAGEEGYWRFFAYLGLFIFMMTILVMGNNLIMLYLGWEGVGLCSYLLIGYYYEKPSAREAAKKAFLVNRVGDFGFGLGIMLSFWAFGTVSYFGNGAGTHTGLLELAMNPVTSYQVEALKAIPFLLMIGAFGKSAQFPLYVWLPDAMEGPTPVSALIHAATMVTAGVYMIVRCGTLFVGNLPALDTIAAIGAFTALLAATIALRQFDLKKVFAYSTISQLGYMFVAVGVLAPVAGVFHLVTHAFFKALLFLSSGVVMHAMAGELDMRKMSGLKRVLPITHGVMLIGCGALAGFPFLSGFYSKDDIVSAAFGRSWVLGLVLLFSAFLTAYYTFRLYFRVFQGPLVVPEAPAPAHGHGHEAHEHAAASDSAIQTGTAPASGVDVGQTSHAPAHGSHDHGEHNHEPLSMIIPLIVLAVGAFGAGYLNFPKNFLGEFLGHSPSLANALTIAQRVNFSPLHAEMFGQEEPGASVPIGGMVIGGMVSLLGIYLAFVLHLKERRRADQLAHELHVFTDVLDHKYWVDELYQNFIVEPLRALGRVCFTIDRLVVDGILNLITAVPQFFGFFLKLTVQRGYLQGYAVAMLFGIVVILLVIFH